MRRVLLSCLAIAFALACGDDITEPTPTRTTAVAAGPLFATTTTEDGLSISTDKDDYQPGDVVHFTGSGWQPGDVLDIVLTDNPLTHDPHIWSVNVDADGTFRDATYVVDEGDLNVEFTLVATSRGTGRSLTVVFTDGSLSLVADATMRCVAVDVGCASKTYAFSPNGDASFDLASLVGSVNGSGAETNVRINVRPGATPGATPIAATLSLGDYSPPPNGITFPTSAWNASGQLDGTYTARIFSNQTAEPATNPDPGARKLTLIVDRVAPTVTLLAVDPVGPTPDLPFTLTARATDEGTRIFKAQYNVDGGTFADMSASDLAFDELTEDVTFAFSAGLSEGSHPLCVKAEDVAGNVSAAACITLQVAAPNVPTSLQVEAASGTYGGQTTLLAKLTRTSTHAGIDGKTITFRLNGSEVGTATTVASGEASLTVYLTDDGLGTGSFIDQGTYTAGAGSGVGASFAGDAPLDPSSGSASLTISPRPITVKADAKTKVYGNTDPAFTYQITDGSLVGTDVMSGALSRDAGETVTGSPYAILQGSLTVGTNYTLTYVGAGLTITERAITVTAAAKNKDFGDADPPLTYQITSGSLAFSDDFTGALTRDAGETLAGSPYAITRGTLALDANYILTFVGASLTINPRPVTVTAQAKNKFYGDPDPALTYLITSGSVLAGDGFTGALTRAAGETVAGNPYAITQGTLALNPNYNLTFVGANFTINPRPVTVTPDAQSKYFGESDPTPLTYKVTSGTLVSGDAFTGILIRDAGEGVGSYTIRQGTLSLGGNYDLSFVPANLVIQSWRLAGFYQPVDMPLQGGAYAIVWNTVKGGSTVPFKFEVFRGATELKDLAVVQPLFTKEVACVGNVSDAIELTATGGTVLRFDTSGDQFIYNWQTPRKPGYCYQVTMKTADGSPLVAYFQLK